MKIFLYLIILGTLSACIMNPQGQQLTNEERQLLEKVLCDSIRSSSGGCDDLIWGNGVDFYHYDSCSNNHYYILSIKLRGMPGVVYEGEAGYFRLTESGELYKDVHLFEFYSTSIKKPKDALSSIINNKEKKNIESISYEYAIAIDSIKEELNNCSEIRIK